MNFELRSFVKKGLVDAVGKLADYQVILNAAAWKEKGVLTEGDLSELEVLIENKNKALSETVITYSA